MAFPCSTTEVNNLIPHRTFGSATKPTTTQVTAYINSRAAEIRAVLRLHNISESSLTDNAVALLNRINAVGAACDAEKAARGQAQTLTDRTTDFCEDFKDWIEKLEDNPGYLSTDEGEAATMRSRWTTASPSDESSDTEDEKMQPKFTRDEKY